MYGREKLEEFYGCYNKYEADKVMDAMHPLDDASTATHK